MKRTKVSDELHIFGERLKTARKKAHLSQEDLADKLNTDVTTVRNWEQHYNLPENETLLRLCKILDCDIDFLFGRINEAPTHKANYICEATGLNVTAVERLLEMKRDFDNNNDEYLQSCASLRLSVTSELITNGNLIEDIEKYIVLHTSDISSLKIYGYSGEREITSEQLTKKYDTYRITVNDVGIDTEFLKSLIMKSIESDLNSIRKKLLID